MFESRRGRQKICQKWQILRLNSSVTPRNDQRSRKVALTEHGTNTLLKALPVWEAAQAHIVQGVGEETFSLLLTQLSNIAELTQEG